MKDDSTAQFACTSVLYPVIASLGKEVMFGLADGADEDEGNIEDPELGMFPSAVQCVEMLLDLANKYALLAVSLESLPLGILGIISAFAMEAGSTIAVLQWHCRKQRFFAWLAGVGEVRRRGRFGQGRVGGGGGGEGGSDVDGGDHNSGNNGGGEGGDRNEVDLLPPVLERACLRHGGALERKHRELRVVNEEYGETAAIHLAAILILLIKSPSREIVLGHLLPCYATCLVAELITDCGIRAHYEHHGYSLCSVIYTNTWLRLGCFVVQACSAFAMIAAGNAAASSLSVSGSSGGGEGNFTSNATNVTGG